MAARDVQGRGPLTEALAENKAAIAKAKQVY